MNDTLPPALLRAIESRDVPDRGAIVARSGPTLVTWSAGEVRGLPRGGRELELIDAEGVLPVQLSRGHGPHDSGGGLRGRFDAFLHGASRDSVFVELRGRARVRLHAVIEGRPRLESLATELPALALEGSTEVEPDALLDLLAALHARGARFLLGAIGDAPSTGRRVVSDDDRGVVGLPALAWVELAASSSWVGRSLGDLDLHAVALSRAGGAFVPTASDVLAAGDAVLVATLAGNLAGIRRAAGVGTPLPLEREVLREAAAGEVLLSAGDFGATEHDPGRQPPAWRYPAIGTRAGIMGSLVDVRDLPEPQTPIGKIDLPDGAFIVAVFADGTWKLAGADRPRGNGLVLLAGDRLAVAEAETTLQDAGS